MVLAVPMHTTAIQSIWLIVSVTLEVAIVYSHHLCLHTEYIICKLLVKTINRLHHVHQVVIVLLLKNRQQQALMMVHQTQTLIIQ